MGLLVLVVIIFVLILLPCLISCLLKVFKESLSLMFMVQQKGGHLGIGLGGTNSELALAYSETKY